MAVSSNYDQNIDKYICVRKLGKGAFSTVDLVVDAATQKNTFARKTIEKINRNKLGEIKVLKFLTNDQSQSKFIIKLFDHFEDEINAYLILEFVSGESISKLLKSKKQFCEETAKFFAIQMILAIDFLHSSNVIHRDIKPENVLLASNRYIKIGDFGFAKIMKDKLRYSLCGTTEYLAPEILKGEGYGMAVDWWSMGVFIFEMLRGRTPFKEETEEKTKHKIKLRKFKFPLTFSESLISLIKKFLKKSPEKRFGNNIDDIKKHDWFTHSPCYCWDNILNQIQPSPINIGL